MTQPAEGQQGHPEAYQRNNNLRILPFQSHRAMRTNKPPPGIRIKDKRGSNFLRASRALRHGQFPLRSTVPRSFHRVNGTYDFLCRMRTDPVGAALQTYLALGVARLLCSPIDVTMERTN